MTNAIPAVTDATMERLAFIRHLVQLGVDQSRQPEPANSIAIFMFHDAADLFLQLGSEFRSAPIKGTKNISLLEYFNLLAPRLNGIALEGQQGIRRLSKTRDNLKHHGIRPAANDVESLRSGTLSFFESNAPLIFGIAFDQISMAQLVVLQEARQFLEKSEVLASSGDLEGAIEACATAFAHLMQRHHQLEPTPYRDKHRMPISALGSGGVTQFLQSNVQDLDDHVRQLSRAMETLQERVTFLALGIEPADIQRFKRIAPNVQLSFNGTPRISGFGPPSKPTIDDVRFSYTFVVGVALALQRRW